MFVLNEADEHFATIQSFRRGMPQPSAQHKDVLVGIVGVMPCNLQRKERAGSQQFWR